jgi:lipoyl-dependent peroxiredoxin
MKRFGSTGWNGGLREGKGGGLDREPRFGKLSLQVPHSLRCQPGTNPEGLVGAAHAASFTMSFVRMLEMANFVAEQVDSKSDVVIDKDGDGFSITSVHLADTTTIPGIESIASKANAPFPS